MKKSAIRNFKLILLTLTMAMSLIGCDSEEEVIEDNSSIIANAIEESKVTITEISSNAEFLDIGVSITSELRSPSYTMEGFYELNENIKSYITYAIKDSSIDTFSILNDLSGKIDDSLLYTSDFDSDGIPDIFELLVTDTSPMSKTTGNSSLLDGNRQFDFSIYLNNTDSGITTSNILLGKYYDMIYKNVNDLRYGEFVNITGRSYGKDLKAFEINSTTIGLEEEAYYTFPITFRINGLYEDVFSGSVKYVHKDYSDLVALDNMILWQSATDLSRQGFDSYLERSTHTTIIPNGVYKNRDYYLVFPKILITDVMLDASAVE